MTTLKHMSEKFLQTKGVLARLCVILAIRKVLKFKIPFYSALEQCEYFSSLSEVDQSFVRHLCFEYFRRKTSLDSIVRKLIDKPKKGRASYFIDILSLSLVQLWYTSVPVYAIFSTASVLLDIFDLLFFRKLLHRILQNLEVSSAPCAIPEPYRSRWLVAYGEDFIQAVEQSILTSHVALDLTIKNQSRENLEFWSQQLKGEIVGSSTVRLTGSPSVRSLEGYAMGEWWVQDISSSFPVNQLPFNLSGQIVFDLCAAPGGKTAQLLARGAEVYAVDSSRERLKILEDNMRRLNFTPHVIESCVEEWQPPVLADIVVLDPPCSSTGTFRRHPEVLYLHNVEDLCVFVAKQQKLLEKAVGFLKNGGFLSYSTCSLEPEEGEKMVSFIASRFPELVMLSQGAMRLLPDIEGGDGFFSVLYQKI